MNVEHKEFALDAAFAAAPRKWLEAVAGQMELRWLLAFADDGVIWGRIDQTRLVTAREALGGSHPEVATELRCATLQQLRLFGPAGELHLCRVGEGFEAWLTREGRGSQTPTGDSPPDAPAQAGAGDGVGQALPDEIYWLWGDAQETAAGFILMREGAQGLVHAPPDPHVPPIPVERDCRLGLRVRHYLGYDDNSGRAFIRFSRLVALEPIGGKHGVTTH